MSFFALFYPRLSYRKLATHSILVFVSGRVKLGLIYSWAHVWNSHTFGDCNKASLVHISYRQPVGYDHWHLPLYSDGGIFVKNGCQEIFSTDYQVQLQAKLCVRNLTLSWPAHAWAWNLPWFAWKSSHEPWKYWNSHFVVVQGDGLVVQKQSAWGQHFCRETFSDVISVAYQGQQDFPGGSLTFASRILSAPSSSKTAASAAERQK